MLVPDIQYGHKYTTLLYSFLDLNMAIEEEMYKGIVANCIKFPSVFKLPVDLAKTVQAFWNLDHGHLLAAVADFTSPISKSGRYPQWLVELLIEALLSHQAGNMALRILETQSYLISSSLKVRTLLASKLLSEAFHYVRSQNDDSLLQLFFNSCLNNGQFGVIRDFALTEREGLILQDILKKSKLCGAKSLHFVYLLQKSKYIEAVSYMDELAKNKISSSHVSHRGISGIMDTPNLVLSAFNTTMAPITKGLTDVYFKIKNKLTQEEFNNSSPVPFSCQLIKQNANNLLGGIYHSSALSAHFATYYWGEMDDHGQCEPAQVMNSNNAPFLRRPQVQSCAQDLRIQKNISYPQVYKPTDKRRYVEIDMHEDDMLLDPRISDLRGNPSKRRRQEVIGELNHIMRNQRKNRHTNVNTYNITEIDGEDTLCNDEINEAENFLKESLIKVTNTETTNVSKKQPLIEIQSILKSTNVTMVDGSVEEEKNLRFHLPDNDKEEDDDNTPLLTFLAEEEKQKENATTISIDSSRESVDDFYSNLSSQPNLNPLLSQSFKLDTSSSQTYMTGPLPRKPLARLSMEKPEKSIISESVNIGPNQTDLSDVTVPDELLKISPLVNEEMTSDCGVLGVLSTNVSSDNLFLHGRQNDSSLSAVIIEQIYKSNDIASQETVSKVATFSTHDLKSEKSEYSKSSFTNESSISLKNLTSQHFAPKISSSKLAQTVSDVCDANLMVTARNISSSSGFNSNNSKESTENPEVKMMETTLDMTNFEISTLEKSTTEPCQTLFLTAANTVKEEDAMKNKLSEGETITSSPHEEEMDFETSVCKTKEGEGESLSPLTTEFQNLQQTDNIQSPKDEAYIIVSLSSSSLSSYDNQDEKLSQSPDQTFCIDENECMDNLNTKDTKETTTNEELYDPYEYEEDIEDIEDVEDVEDIEDIEDVEDNENIVFDYSEEEKLSINENDSDEFVDFVEDSSRSTSRNKSDENEDGVTDVFVVVDEQAVEKCDSSQQTCFDSFEDEDHKVQADASSLSIESQEAIVSCQPTLLGQKRTEDNQFSREPQSPKPVSLHEEEEKVSSQKPVISYFEDDNQKHLTLKTFMTPETMLPPEDSTSLASEIDMQINEHMDTSALQLDDVAHPLSNFEPIAEAIHMQILEHATTSTTTLKTVSDVEKFSETDEIVFSNASKIGHESKSIIEQNTKEITSLEYNQVKEPLTRNQGSCELINSKSDNEKPEKTCESIHVQLEKEEIIEIYSDDDTQLSEKAPELVKKKLSEVEQKSSLKIEELVDVENLDQQNLEGHKFIQNFDCRERNSSTVKKTDVAVQSYSVAAESTQTDPMVIPEIAVFSECEIAMEADAISFTDIDKEKDKVSVKTWIEAIERQLDASPTESRVNSERKSEEFVTNSPEVVASEIEGGENLISLKTEDFSDDVKPISIQNLQDPNLTQIEERQESLENMKTSVKSRRTLRGSSEPPKEKETNTSNIRIPHNRAKRGISLPPQTAGKTGHFTAAITSSTFSELNYCGESDNKEGSVNNPLAKTSDNKSNEATLNSPGQNSSPHYDSLQSMTATISKSRHSNLLEVISENPSPLDSPSSRTRSRLRGSSVNSDLDINLSGSNPSIVKRIRCISKSSSTSELPSARKRVRRASTGSETGSIDSTTPRRAKSVMSQQGEETESTSESPKVTDRTRSHLKRGKKGEEFKKNSSETPRSVKIRGGRAQSVMSLQEEEFESISESPKSTDLGKTSSEMVSLSESDLGYSSTRRLTRNQLAVLEKSAKLTELYKKSMKAEIERPYTPTQTASKQLRKTRSTRSNTSLQQESDDNESIISKRSTTSSTGRRVTRRSIKEKDETEDDQVSVISSVDSETSYIRSLRSRGKSLSSTALAAIPEVSSKANKEARKTSRSTQ
uniref:ELYS domain-containing protein n=1 Tax=Glossina brevipalpis TaxID=37001 RepID=A0A1A9WDP9_9MUSC